MILKPNDILQKGDIFCQITSSEPIGESWFGKTVAYFMKNIFFPDLVIGIERPDPAMSAEEKIRILRETLELAAETLDAWRPIHPDDWDIGDITTMQKIRAALEATK